MLGSEKEIINKLSNLSVTVKQEFRKQGVEIPVKVKNGIKLGDYTIEKTNQGYRITDKWGDILYNYLYNIQAAILITNALACKRTVKQDWIASDFNAGTSEFDVKLFEQRLKTAIVKQDAFEMGHFATRLEEAKLKYKKYFEQLQNEYARFNKSLSNKNK